MDYVQKATIVLLILNLLLKLFENKVLLDLN